MTAADLETVVARTGHARFRWLTSDDNPDAVQREAYRALVARLAAEPADGPPPEPAVSNRHTKALALVRECRDGAEPPACGCDSTAFCRRLGRDAALSECLAHAYADLDADDAGQGRPPS